MSSSSSSSSNFIGGSSFFSGSGFFGGGGGFSASFFFFAGAPFLMPSSGAVSSSTSADAFFTRATKTFSHFLQRTFFPIEDSGARIFVLHSGQVMTIVSAMAVSSPVVRVRGSGGPAPPKQDAFSW